MSHIFTGWSLAKSTLRVSQETCGSKRDILKMHPHWNPVMITRQSSSWNNSFSSYCDRKRERKCAKTRKTRQFPFVFKRSHKIHFSFCMTDAKLPSCIANVSHRTILTFMLWTQIWPTVHSKALVLLTKTFQFCCYKDRYVVTTCHSTIRGFIC